jgi:hypothetical protein
VETAKVDSRAGSQARRTLTGTAAGAGVPEQQLEPQPAEERGLRSEREWAPRPEQLSVSLPVKG